MTVAVAWFEVTPPPLAVATFVRLPAVTSAWAIVCVEVQVVEPPAASGPEPHGEIVPCLSSVMLNGPLSVVWPEFVIS